DSVVVASGLAGDRTNRRQIVVLDAAAERIGEQLLGGGAEKIFAVLLAQQLVQTGRTVELGAVGQLAAGVDWRAGILATPPADRVVVLQREADLIHAAVAGGAGRIAPVHFHLLAHRQHLAVGRRLQFR